ncbi:unnamed protein product [Rotaria socialis]|uniref:Uncharacterized protein n=2 Tax=Rotaria socialis TaxID=392032 RepID=A0A818Z6Q9_9BILA|nr:unnamed protein product [Rotaria socialis]
MNHDLISGARFSNCGKYVFGGHHLFSKSHCRQLHHYDGNKVGSSPSLSLLNLCLMKLKHRNEASGPLNKLFFQDKPISKTLSFDLPNEPTEFTNVCIEQALRDKCSHVAIDINQQKLIGVSINVIENVNEQKNVFDGPQFKSGKLRYVMKVFADAHDQVDLFKTFHTDCLLHLLIVVVDENYRGLNLTG